MDFVGARLAPCVVLGASALPRPDAFGNRESHGRVGAGEQGTADQAGEDVGGDFFGKGVRAEVTIDFGLNSETSQPAAEVGEELAHFVLSFGGESGEIGGEHGQESGIAT